MSYITKEELLLLLKWMKEVFLDFFPRRHNDELNYDCIRKQNNDIYKTDPSHRCALEYLSGYRWIQSMFTETASLVTCHNLFYFALFYIAYIHRVNSCIVGQTGLHAYTRQIVSLRLEIIFVLQRGSSDFHLRFFLESLQFSNVHFPVLEAVSDEL